MGKKRGKKNQEQENSQYLTKAQDVQDVQEEDGLDLSDWDTAAPECWCPRLEAAEQYKKRVKVMLSAIRTSICTADCDLIFSNENERVRESIEEAMMLCDILASMD